MRSIQPRQQQLLPWIPFTIPTFRHQPPIYYLNLPTRQGITVAILRLPQRPWRTPCGLTFCVHIEKVLSMARRGMDGIRSFWHKCYFSRQPPAATTTTSTTSTTSTPSLLLPPSTNQTRWTAAAAAAAEKLFVSRKHYSRSMGDLETKALLLKHWWYLHSMKCGCHSCRSSNITTDWPWDISLSMAALATNDRWLSSIGIGSGTSDDGTNEMSCFIISSICS